MTRVWNTSVFVIATVYFLVDGIFSYITRPITVWLAKKQLLQRVRTHLGRLGVILDTGEGDGLVRRDEASCGRSDRATDAGGVRDLAEVSHRLRDRSVERLAEERARLHDVTPPRQARHDLLRARVA